MKPFIRLLDEAAQDPQVVSIRISLYRVARQSEIIHSLIAAAENGKDVIVVVELRARFDEEQNIEWATRLTEVGCRVVYGGDACKVHCKLLLITRKTERSIQYITQIGTGNYNERTARLYTDLSLITANPDIGLDAVALFNDILVNNLQGAYNRLLVSPSSLRDAVLNKIDGEIAHAAAGRPAAVMAKLNSMTDKLIIDKLIEASQAGVEIRLMIRGICCLRPGVPGKTDNITVISIVGRFLEHSRVYCFGSGERREVYMASADWMTRNMERRIEVACPILDRSVAARIVDMLELGFADNVKARRLCADGTYESRTLAEAEPLMNSQLHQFKLAYRAAGKDMPL
jgi:polyphosphate kinase